MKNMSAWVRIAIAMAFCTAAGAQEPASINVSIQPQPIRAALKEFGEQTGLQVLLRVEDVSTDGIMAPAVTGKLTPKVALDKLLEKSGLTYEFVNARTVRILGKGAQATSRVATGAELQLARVDEPVQGMQKVE